MALLKAVTAACIAVCAFAADSMAQQAAYPTHPVRFIVSFAAGGPNDTIARILGQYLSEQLGQQFLSLIHI